jgi:two-component system CheB/CheR fusion protein
VTVNSELQANVDLLASMHNDMKNLLDNTNFATIFLDRHLIIRRFTREATKLYRLVATDVGRPLGDIKSGVLNEDLAREAAAVLETLMPFEREVRTDSGAYLARIHPYRTLDNVIEGVVLTFSDITKMVAAEAEMRRARQLGERIVDTVREPLVVLDRDMKVTFASRSFYRHFHTTPEDTLGLTIYALGNRQWDIPALHELLEHVLPEHKSFAGFEVAHEFPVIGGRRTVLNASIVTGDSDETEFILLAIEDTGPA